MRVWQHIRSDIWPHIRIFEYCLGPKNIRISNFIHIHWRLYSGDGREEEVLRPEMDLGRQHNILEIPLTQLLTTISYFALYFVIKLAASASNPRCATGLDGLDSLEPRTDSVACLRFLPWSLRTRRSRRRRREPFPPHWAPNEFRSTATLSGIKRATDGSLPRSGSGRLEVCI